MGIFDKLREPVFLKSDSSAHRQLEQLQAIDPSRLPDEVKAQWEREIKMVSYGIQGENAIEFELRNSHIPMYVLHDLYLEDENLSAQIDYLVITRRRNYVVECKNLYGNIEINEKGDFIRTLEFGKRFQKEGIYSPVTQNRRHLELIKMIRKKSKGLLTGAIFEKYFLENYRSVVVLANAKTVLRDKFAAAEIKAQVIRADGLIEYIRKNNASGAEKTERDTESLAKFFLDAHRERSVDFAEKYRSQYIASAPKPAPVPPKPVGPVANEPVACPKCGAAMILRTAKKGGDAGKQFWGCLAFPKCRGTLPAK
jgi:hypothetical protein